MRPSRGIAPGILPDERKVKEREVVQKLEYGAFLLVARLGIPPYETRNFEVVEASREDAAGSGIWNGGEQFVACHSHLFRGEGRDDSDIGFWILKNGFVVSFAQTVVTPLPIFAGVFGIHLTT